MQRAAVSDAGARPFSDLPRSRLRGKQPTCPGRFFLSAGYLMPAKKDQPPPDLRYFNRARN
jgi:hypothetical protein